MIVPLAIWLFLLRFMGNLLSIKYFIFIFFSLDLSLVIITISCFYSDGGGDSWNGWLKHVFRFGRISSWEHVSFCHARALSGHCDLPEEKCCL